MRNNRTLPSRRGPIALLIVAVLLVLGPWWGLLGTVIGMVRAFGELGQPSAGNTETLASDISVALWSTTAGMIASPIGLVLLILAIIWLVKVNRTRNQYLNPLDPPA